MEQLQPPVPTVPRKPRAWIAAIPISLLIAIGAPLVLGTIGLAISAMALIIAIAGGYQILRWRADVDYYDWYHGPGNPYRPKAAG